MYRDPVLATVYVLDEHGHLVYPTPAQAGEDMVQDFEQRCRSLLNEGSLRAPTVDTVGEDSGWLPLFRHDGLHLIYRHRTAGGWTLGYELNRARFLADVVALLPASPAEGSSAGGVQERLELRDSRGETVYRWGLFDVADDVPPFVHLPLSSPLGAWTLTWSADPADLDALSQAPGSHWLLALGTAGFAIAMAALAAAIYRDASRRLTEAATRVTFVNRVSHELKTPLTNIRLYTEMLEDCLDGQDETATTYLGVIGEETRRLSRLIHNVLTFSRNRRGALQVSCGAVELNAVVRRAAAQFGPEFERCEMTVEATWGDAGRVEADADALEQILVNLFSNAVKYATAGRHVGIRTDGDATGAWVRVCDRGPGVPAGWEERVFRPFERVSDRLEDGVSGTGIGLSISRELARAQGGDLRVRPAEQGACFELRLRQADPTSKRDA